MARQALAAESAAEIPADDPVVRLAVDAALGYFSAAELRHRSGLEPEVFEALMASPDMQLAISEYRRELGGQGTPLRMKAARMLWEVMDELRLLARMADEPGDRIAAIRELAKIAGTEVAAGEQARGSSGPMTIQIVQFSGSEGSRRTEGGEADVQGSNRTGVTINGAPVEIRKQG